MISNTIENLNALADEFPGSCPHCLTRTEMTRFLFDEPGLEGRGRTRRLMSVTITFACGAEIMINRHGQMFGYAECSGPLLSDTPERLRPRVPLGPALKASEVNTDERVARRERLIGWNFPPNVDDLKPVEFRPQSASGLGVTLDRAGIEPTGEDDH